MQIVGMLTCLLTIVSTAIDVVEATPVTPDLSRLRLSGKISKKDGSRKRKAGDWKDPVLFNSIFDKANEMLNCLRTAVHGYYDTTQPPAYKALLDKYFMIHDDPGRHNVVWNNVDYFARTDDLMVFGDEFGDGRAGAFILEQTIKGRKAQAMILIHESIHALMPIGTHGDNIRIKSDGTCEFMSSTMHKAWIKKAKDENTPEIMEKIHKVYWRDVFMHSWETVKAACPDSMIGIPDATMAAAYECVHGHEPDLRGSAHW